MTIKKKTLIRFPLPLVFIVISVLFAFVTFVFLSFDPFQTVEDAPIALLREQKPITIANRVYFPGECKVQLYGWIYKNPGPTDGADQYLKINNLNAVLNSELIDAKEDLNNERDINEHIWTINTPSTGVLMVTIKNYEKPRDDINYGTIFLTCHNSITQKTFLGIVVVTILSGLIGLILSFVSLVKRGIHFFKS